VREMARRTAGGQPPTDDDAELYEHIEGCASCRETIDVAAWMQELASTSASNAPPPDPTYLWWKAELLRRWDAQQRAAAPVEVGEQVQAGIGLVSALALLGWLWHALPSAATSLTVSMIVSGLVLTATAVIMVRDLLEGS
jgi:hypothetical protein